MNILRILDTCDGGGILSYEIQFINQIKKRGHKVDALLIDKGEQEDHYRKLVSNVIFHQKEYPYRRLRRLNTLLKVNRFSYQVSQKIGGIVNGSYDAIMYSRPIFIHIAGHLSKTLNVKSFWHMPNSINNNIQKLYYTYYLKKYGIIPIANSQYTARTLGSICNNFVYPGYDEERVHYTQPYYRKKFEIPKNAVVYGMATRIVPAKAVDIVVESFVAFIRKSNTNSYLIIAGGPLGTEYHNRVKTICSEYIGKKIFFLDRISDVSLLYSSVDVMINGRRNAEPFGITVAESLAFGKPVIAFFKGGPSEMISEKENGWLVQTPDAKSYLKAIEESYNSKHKLPEMSEAAKESSKSLSVKYSVDKLLKILKYYSSNI